jgi:diguanylate cyclase (GGDEF)-like protein
LPKVRPTDAHPSISRSRQLVATSILLTVVLILAAMVAILGLRQGAITDTEDDNHRLGVVLAEQTTRTIQGVDFVLRNLLEQIDRSGVTDAASFHAAFGGREVHEALARRLADLPQAGGFAILDADGHVVNQSRTWPTQDYSYTDRAYFQHFAMAEDPRAYLSEPIASRANEGMRAVILARRVTAPDGGFLGIVVSRIQLDYFNALFARIGFSDGTGVTIMRSDGVFLVHYPVEVVSPGARLPDDSRWYEVMRNGGGHYLSRGVTEEIGPRLVSVHPLATYPIVLNVTRVEAAALARWREEAIAIGAGTLAVTLCFAFLLLALTRQIAIIEASQSRIQRQVDAARDSEARLAAQSALLETTLEHMNQGLMVVDKSGIVAVCNRQAIEMLQLPEALMATRPEFEEVIAFQTRQGEFGAALDKPPDRFELFLDRAVYERRRPNGMVLEVRNAVLPDGGIVRTYADITARTAAEEMLGVAASHDQLTGLTNRLGFNTRREALLAVALRTDTELSVLCLDLDRFKAVNDTLGHDAGDQLLVTVARRIQESVRVTDVAARLGGDEFAILLPATDLSSAEGIAQRLLESIRLPYAIGAHVVRIGVSIGIATYPSDGDTAEELLRNADAALYKAKAAGRDTWRVYASEDGQRQHARMALELDFRTAVATGQFILAYQPICDTMSGAPVAFEALVRWNHPDRGMISPGEFIPIAEQTGLIIPLGRWILETACAEAAAWAVPLRIGVNLSPAQFREGGLVAFIRDVLARTGLAAERLDLEVTEGLLLDDADDVVKTMNALRAMGIRMVLDDFGTSHSNLSYLRGFPFEVVKIDQSFMRALNTDRQARALVEAILAMARALGLEVIGEGIETPEQLALLRHLRCRLVQGYLLGRPAPAAETRDLIWGLAASRATNGGQGRALAPAVDA